jgi:hypothetical protein
MDSGVLDLVKILIAEEIRRIVAEAIRDGGCLSITPHAAQVLRAYPDSGLTEREVGDEILIAAARAGVAVEIDRRTQTVDARRQHPAEAA